MGKKNEYDITGLTNPFADAPDGAAGTFHFVEDKTAEDGRGIAVSKPDAHEKKPWWKLTRRRSSVGIMLTQNTTSEQARVYIVALLVYLISFYVLSLMMVKLKYMGLPYKVAISTSPFSLLIELMSSSMPILIMTLGLSIGCAYLVLAIYARKTSLINDGGVIRSKNGTYGKSDWLNNDTNELEETFDITADMSKPINVPMGVYKNELFCMPDEPKHNQFKNQNIAILGGSGSGKTFGAIEPFMLNRMAYRQSFIVTDTKGALCRDHYKTCERLGYDVKIFNTIDFLSSDAWNCLKDLINADITNINKYVDIYADTIIKNTVDESTKGESFWESNQKDFLKSCMHLVTKGAAYEGRRTFESLMDLISNHETDEIMAMLGAESPSNPAYIASASLRNTKSDDLKDRFRSGLANRLQIFNSKDIRAVLSYDEIDFEEVVKGPTAIFLITSDAFDTFDALTSLFVTCLYIKLVEISDSPKYGGKLKKPFWFIIDEFCNMAAIRDFSNKISTSRSRNINFVLAIQSLSQLNVKYEKLAGNILANCGTTMFFGCNDPMTSKYVSERAGTFTQIVKSETKERPTIASRLSIPLRKNERVEERPKNLIEISDADQMKSGEVFVFVSGKQPFKAKAYGAPSHGLYKYKQPINLGERQPLWLQEFMQDNPEYEMANREMHTPSDYELEEIRPVYDINEPKEKKIEKAQRTIATRITQMKENHISERRSTSDLTGAPLDAEDFRPKITKADDDEETAERKAEKNNDYRRLISAAKGTSTQPLTAAAPQMQTQESHPNKSHTDQPITDVLEEYRLNSPEETYQSERVVEEEEVPPSRGGFTGNLKTGFTGNLDFDYDDIYEDLI